MGSFKDKTKVCLVLTHRQQLRSWIYNGVFRDLAQNFEMSILLSSDFADFDFEKEFLGHSVQIWNIPRNPEIERLALFLQLVEHKKHKTFRERIRKQILDERVFQKRVHRVLYTLRSIRRKSLLFSIHLQPFYKYYQLKYRKYIEKNSIKKLPLADIYLVITSVSDYSTDVLLHSLKINQKNFIQVVENWDNLSSKLSVNFDPNKLIVWSKQTRDHAVNIHGFNPQAIEILGSPRFPNLEKVNELKRLNSTERSGLTVFYAGYFSACNNLKSVIDICQEVEKSFPNHDLKVIYRPHPINLQATLLEYEAYKPKNIYLDLIASAGVNESNWPTYYDGFYDSMLNSDVIIGTPSTFLLEEIMFNKPIILDYRDCGEHYNSARRYFQHSTHLEEIVASDLIPKMYKVTELPKLIVKVLSGNQFGRDSLKNYLIYNDEIEYSQRLKNALRQMKETLV